MGEDLYRAYISRAIPARFKKAIGFDPLKFNVIDPYPTVEIVVYTDKRGKWLRVPKFFAGKSWRFTDGIATEIPLSIYCILDSQRGHIPILVSESGYPNLFQALKLYREAFEMGPHIQKYITLYKAYESVTTVHNRAAEFSAIRHSLSHSQSSLSRRSTVETLRTLFGGLEIDFHKYAHYRVFYTHFGRLLMLTDQILFDKLIPLVPIQPNLLDHFYSINK